MEDAPSRKRRRTEDEEEDEKVTDIHVSRDLIELQPLRVHAESLAIQAEIYREEKERKFLQENIAIFESELFQMVYTGGYGPDSIQLKSDSITLFKRMLDECTNRLYGLQVQWHQLNPRFYVQRTRSESIIEVD